MLHTAQEVCVIYRGEYMKKLETIAKGSFLLGLLMFTSACVVATPREGAYDRDHHRYYHEREWHECGEHDNYCR